MNKNVMIGTVIVVLILVFVGFYYSNNVESGTVSNNDKTEDVTSSGSGAVIQADGNTKVISISAQKYDYTPGTITVKKGDHVRITLVNKDAQHGIVIPGFNVKGMDSVEFDANKTGTFEFRCPTFCGEGHREMKGTLIVEE
ncbi:MAG: cupredoxin domain-containing protein [Nanoarchaeota archaeon]|nr:cupredoxin domain-containing protein [Nanoarchaeota archaeon]